ncbi:hypothetical protein CYLTODRAFT_376545 [Cylindrobasidium torrendii FP15055 ss-10]|uniref:Methyltransferase domain-containing protein n=1 Tax=Cylindrobasidium torrendii FP15055 ss-10 TaxID=1314674 RepID=A0A0D7B9K0_9AGAR|nr:hypothetical protein CYLTODRAFT_376545 [Cylindrobasidium torrendii FP15055 ss-10]
MNVAGAMYLSAAFMPPTAARQPARPVSTLGMNPGSYEGKRKRENNFITKYGQKHHSYDNEKAPYPLSYDRHVLELESLDNSFIKYLRDGSVSFLNVDAGGPPEYVLDLGCGMGTWVLEAAQQWKDTSFVGFDLVNVQVPTKYLDESIQSRISWVYGNFLTTRLPFEDDEFDHVHVQSIARSVPENKWDNVFDEIVRVLRPGGSIEIYEEDAVFPKLPRWFTSPLHSRPRRGASVHLPDGSRRGYPSQPDTPQSATPAHDHALLESLYTSVFEHRFINMKPSSLLPNYFITYFRHCTLGPVISFPMPPVPPAPPLPDQLVSNYSFDLDQNIDIRASTLFAQPGKPERRLPSVSFSSTISSDSTMNSTDHESTLSTLFSVNTREKTASTTSRPKIEISLAPPNPDKLRMEKLPSTPEAESPPAASHLTYMLDSSSTDLTSVPSIPAALFPSERLASLDERSLAMHLFKSYQVVLASREALWEELQERIQSRKHELAPFGWDSHENFDVDGPRDPQRERRKFEMIVDRYAKDMQTRVSLWCSLHNIGWPFPAREPLSKAELIEEERLRDAMTEARQYAPPEDLRLPCRTIRILVGYKPQ